jgi:hypothetical protein
MKLYVFDLVFFLVFSRSREVEACRGGVGGEAAHPGLLGDEKGRRRRCQRRGRRGGRVDDDAEVGELELLRASPAP